MKEKLRIFTAISEGIDSSLISAEMAIITQKKFSLSFLGITTLIASNFRKKIESILQRNNLQVEGGEYIINLLPNDVVKNDASIDLAMAILIMKANGFLSKEVIDFIDDTIFIGELSLDGDVFPVKNALSTALNLSKMGKKRIVIPFGNSKECSLIKSNNIYTITHISDIFSIDNLKNIKEFRDKMHAPAVSSLDLNQVYGQEQSKRALEIAAAGRHNILLYGSPGSGKTMLAQRISSIMPQMTEEEIIETTRIYSSAGMLDNGNPITEIPFRRPHHSVSSKGLIGGGYPIYPGEISLAHNGVLFMDEFLEFSKSCIESLRECIEERKVHLKRGRDNITYPASCMLVSALNPCPCGYFGEDNKKCTCSLNKIKYYMSKMSGPLLDRIDIQVNLKTINFKDIVPDTNYNSSSKAIKERIKNAISRQFSRNGNRIYNGLIPPESVDSLCNLSTTALQYLKDIFDSLTISMRSYHKIIKISRTIADLADKEYIEIEHIKEALLYRSFDALMRKFDVIG